MHELSKLSVAPCRFTPWLAGAALLLAGCGQKGPLTLPQAAPGPAAAAASAPAK